MGPLKLYRLGITLTALITLVGAGCGGSSKSPSDGATDGKDASTDVKTDAAGGAGGSAGRAGTDGGVAGMGADAAAGGIGTDGGAGHAATDAGSGGTAGGAGRGGSGGTAAGGGGAGGIAGGTAGAGGGTGGTVARTLTRIEIAPPAPTLGIGTNVVLTITAVYSDTTTADVSTAATITSAGTAVATVSGHTVTAVAAGSTTVTASYMGQTATATVTVSSAALQTIAVDPAAPSLAIGATQQLAATGAYVGGGRQDITTSVVWTSSDATISTVSASGLVTAVKAGTATISAKLTTITGTAIVTVKAATVTLSSIDIQPTNPTIPLGNKQQFTATATYSDQTTLDVTSQSTWTVSDATVASITAGGNLSTVAVGTVVVSAVSGGVTGTTTVTVKTAQLVSIAVSPATATVNIGATQAFTAKGTYTDGTTADVTQTATWSTDIAAASISNAAGQQGVATGISAGANNTAVNVNVSATIGTIKGGAVLTVSPAIVTSVALTPKTASLPVGFTQALSLKATYSDGTIRDVTAQAVWSSSDSTVATVANASSGGNVAGTVTAVKVGTSTVTASFSGMSDTAAITVTAAVPVEVDVSPATASVAAGLTQPFTALAKYSDGTSADVSTQVTWSSSATTIATVSNATGTKGTATGVAVGSATITASLATPTTPVTGTAALTVTAAVVQSIQLTPFIVNVNVGASQALTVTALRSNGTTATVTTTSTVTSSNTAIATVATTAAMGPNGGTRATGVAAGAATLTATYTTGGVTFTATSPINVTAPMTLVLTGLSITPALADIRVGLTQPYVATAIYNNGTSTATVTGTTTWSSSNTAVANISNAGGGGPGGGGRGTATGIAVGSVTITGTYMGFTATATLRVSMPVVTGIEISPVSPTLVVNHTQQFTATALYDNGTTATVTTTTTWTSSVTTVLAISDAAGGFGGGTPRGQATALAQGTSVITASYTSAGMTFTATTTVTVKNPVLTSVMVTPTNPEVVTNGTIQFTATALYDDLSTANVTANAVWVSATPSVASVSSAGATRGRASGLTAGTAVITATYLTLSGSSLLTVKNLTVSSVQVTPTGITLPVGLTQRYTAIAIMSDSSQMDVTTGATWSSSDATVATLSNAAGAQGTATPVKASTVPVTVTATYMGISGTTTLTVSAGKLSTIQVTGISGTLAVGGHAQLVATGTYDDGSSYVLTNLVTWISTTPATATVSNASGSQGLVTGVAAGTTSLEAHFSGITGTAALTVGP